MQSILAAILKQSREAQFQCQVRPYSFSVEDYALFDGMGAPHTLLTASRLSSRPSPASAASASKAAGTAPASTSPLSTLATPRKISSPSPPAPIAAAIVATPTQVTVAVRSPARITLAASGSSTFQSRCHEVIPIASATSTRAGSTLLMPA